MSLESLYRAVLADPAADEPRRKYADAVAATDPARAKLIRLQLRVVQLRAHGGAWQAPHLEAVDLLEANEQRWAKNVLPLADGVRFFRGFVDQVTLPAAKFAANAAKLYDLAPIRHVDLKGMPHAGTGLFSNAALERIVSLGLCRSRVSTRQVEALVSSSHLGNLRWLDLSHNALPRETLEVLAGSPWIRNLDFVDVKGNRFDDPVDQVGVDWSSNRVESVTGTPLGAELERAHGQIRWLHPDPAGIWPPLREDLR